MRYSSAMVLSTFAVGQAAAAHLHNRHASFHARRQAEAKRSAAIEDVNWNALAYDLKDVDWSKVNYGNPASSPAPTPAAQETPKATQTPESKPEPTVAAAKVETPASSVAEKPAPAPSATEATVKTESVGSDIGDLIDNIGDGISDLVGDIMHGVEKLCKDLGIGSTGKNDKSNNGAMWIGGDSPWKAEFTNDANEDAVIFCWKADGFSGMSLNVNQPEISVGLKSGEKVEVSFAPNVPSACAPAYKDTKLALFGGLDQTWWEVTFGNSGAFDVSRNVNMKGRTVTSKGSKCVSDMETCVFKCKNGQDSCESGSDYDLFGCGAGTGGGGGYDSVMAGTGGGCSMGHAGETVKVSFA
jgi:hypothetical protein